MAHPERFELPTKWFEATYSIQLSYGCYIFQSLTRSDQVVVYHQTLLKNQSDQVSIYNHGQFLTFVKGSSQPLVVQLLCVSVNRRISLHLFNTLPAT